MTQKIVLVDSPRLSPKPRARVLVEDEEGAPSEEPNEGPLPQLPLEVLELVMDHLDSVQDFCNVAQVCQEWRFLICTVDTCWQKAFLRDHGELNADSYASIATWRGKYIAFALDNTCLKLREKASDFDDLEDSSAALERSIQNLLVQLNNLDRTVNSRRWDLNTQLQKVSGSDHVHMSSKLGQQILKAAAAGIPTPPRSSGGSAPDWHGRLTPDVCRSLLDAEEQVKHWSGCLQERKEALRTLLEAQCLQSSMTRSVGAVIQQLRAKRASLEMATKHRTPVRR